MLGAGGGDEVGGPSSTECRSTVRDSQTVVRGWMPEIMELILVLRRETMLTTVDVART